MLIKRAFHLSLPINKFKNSNYIFVLYGLSYSNQQQNIGQCLSIDFYNIESDQWSVLTLNNSLLSHHIFNLYNQYNRALSTQDQTNQPPSNTLNTLINLQLNQSRQIVSIKNLIYILNESCIHCYEFEPKQKQLVCLPYFRLPKNLTNYILVAGLSVKTLNLSNSLYSSESNSESQCKSFSLGIRTQKKIINNNNNRNKYPNRPRHCLPHRRRRV